MLNQAPPRNDSSLSYIKRMWSYFWPQNDRAFRARLLLSFSCLLTAKAVAVCIPLFYRQAIDQLDKSPEQLMGVGLPLAALFAYGSAKFLSSGLAELRDALFARLEQRATHSVALSVFKHLHSLSLRFHLDRKTGKLSRVIERGVQSIDRTLRFLTFNIVPTAIEIIFVVGILLYLYEPLFAIVTGTTLFLYGFFTILVTQWRTKLLRQMNAADDTNNTRAIDSLLNYETVKYFVNEDYEARGYSQTLDQYGKAAVQLKTSLAYLNMGQSFIIALGSTIIMLLAAQRILSGTMTLGDFVLVNSYLMQLYVPLGNLGFAYREIRQGFINIEEMLKLLDEKIEVADAPQAVALKKGPGTIIFDKVSFRYCADRPILEDVSFRVDPGKTLAIVGPSGSGKSTIARLLCRFYDVDKGAISIDNHDIRHVTQSSLRTLLGVVPQDTVLFNNTLGFNIAYGKPNAAAKDIAQAAEMAKLSGFVEKLPLKYETLVGERGLKLSGGEKQRVAIARVVLKNPEIYLFDEATSSLDTRTEKEIQKNIDDISRDRTSVIIAHRLSTVVKADEIIVLVNGTVAERGTHAALLKAKGAYAAMWSQQQKEEQSQGV